MLRRNVPHALSYARASEASASRTVAERRPIIAPSRRLRRATTALLVVGLVAALIGPVAADDAATPRQPSATDVIAGEYLVHLGDARSISPIAGTTFEHLGFGVYRVTDRDRSTDAVTRSRQLSDLLGVPVEPNRINRLLVDNPEPDAASQWSLDNFAQFPGGVDDADIDGELAWDVSTGDGVVVAVIDTGADLDHPDIAANLWTNDGEIPGNGIDDDGNGFVDDIHGWDFYGPALVDPKQPEFEPDNDPEDEAGHGHGSAVAAIVAAPINGEGIAGVAPDAEIMVLRACGFGDCWDSTVIQAVYYAANNGADIINMSFGRDPGEHVSYRLALETASEAGIVLVAAAGNGGMDGIGDDNDVFGLIPASFDIDGLIAVAMTDDADDISPASNFGDETVHIGAPGVDIWTAVHGGGHDDWSGTSFAAPTTAGAAALVREHFGCHTNLQITNALESRGDSVPALAGLTITGKRLNAFGSLGVIAKKNGLVTTVDPGAITFAGGTAGTTWTFGDGTSAMGATAQHVYDRGAYVADDGTDTYDIVVGLDFADTCTNSFKTDIIWFSGKGITLGCDDTPNFCPNDTVIRAHMASFLARALNLPPASDDYFDDDAGSSHEENINRLFEAGVTFGCNEGPGMFCPDDEVTREQMATFLVRALGLPPSPDDYFTDDENSGSHEANINALAQSGITLGCDVEMFCPRDGIERDEMAAFLFRGRMYLP